jgi:hypothetical protein
MLIPHLLSIGWHMTPPSRPIRIIFAAGSFLSLILYIGYSASLVTNLSTETSPIQNALDLAESSIKLFSDKWLPMSRKVMEDMYNTRKVKLKNPEVFYDQLEAIIPNLLKKSLAFITFPDAISVVFHRLNFTDSFFCQTVHTVVVSTVNYANAMYVKKGSPLVEIFNRK